MEPPSELVRMLSSDNFFERQKAAWKLIEMGESAVESLIEALENEENSQVRFKSAWALGEIHDSRALDVLVRALLEDEDETVREWSAAALESIGDPRAVSELALALKSDSNKGVRHRATLALVAFQASETFLELLDEPDVATRQMAIVGLGRLKCQEALEKVGDQIEDEDTELRRRAAWYLGEIGTSKAKDFLKPALKDESHVVRMAAVKSLASIGGLDACRMTLRLTKDEHPQVRLAAVTTLGEIGETKALSRLVEIMFGKDDEEISAWAAWSLGEIRDPQAIDALKEACKSCSPPVAEKAHDSLVQIFGIEPE